MSKNSTKNYRNQDQKSHKHKHKSSENQTIGTIISSARGRCKVLLEDQVVDCLLRISSQASPTVGDAAAVACKAHDTYVVEDLLPRRSILSRCDPHRKHELVIAANIDVAVIVASPKSPPLRLKLIDRYLIAIQRGKIKPVICINKIDQLDDRETLKNRLQVYTELGIDVITCSAHTGEGIASVVDLLDGKTCVFVGHSGVGKSSLLNAINPSLDLDTNTLREADQKGRHTTTASTLYHLTDDIRVIDTPGIREFSLWDIDPDELKSYFPEFAGHGCRFSDCTHTNEPECGVKIAVREGRISKARYESYLRLVGNDEDTEATEEAAFECANCGMSVPLSGAGSEHRNHCPKCLHSMHLDNEPGDRAACCSGLMEPVAVWSRKGGEWAIIHRCRACGELSSNRIAADDNEMLLLSLAAKPLAQPPFPIDRL